MFAADMERKALKGIYARLAGSLRVEGTFSPGWNRNSL
jgi:hypothetical protein